MGDGVGGVRAEGVRAAALGRVLRSAVGLVLPTTCAGCARPGSPWCAACRAAAREPAPAASRPGRAGVPPCWSATLLHSPVRRAVTAHKDGGRRDVAAVLAPLLAAAVGEAIAQDLPARAARAGGEPVLAVPVPAAPAARRRRGDDPVGALARAAVRTVDPDGLLVAPVLRHRRRVQDQSVLSRAERSRNLHGAFEVAPAARAVVRGRVCIVLDDVVTTGATLAEAARALHDAGAGHVLAATVALTA